MATISSLTDGGALQGSDKIPIVRISSGVLTNYTVQGNTFALSSIDSFFTGAGKQTLAPSGYQKLPGGLIIQWGRVAYADIANYLQIPITFNFSFPTSTSPTVLAISDTAQFAVSCTVNNRTSTGANIVVKEYDSTFIAGTVLYIAIGY